MLRAWVSCTQCSFDFSRKTTCMLLRIGCIAQNLSSNRSWLWKMFLKVLTVPSLFLLIWNSLEKDFVSVSTRVFHRRHSASKLCCRGNSSDLKNANYCSHVFALHSIFFAKINSEPVFIGYELNVFIFNNIKNVFYLFFRWCSKEVGL